MAAVVLLILFTSVVSGTDLGATVIIRQPDGPPCPEGERCFSLPECLTNIDTCFASFTTLEFDPGNHYTDGIETFVQVRDVTDLALTGEVHEGAVSVRIRCTTKIGFAFVNVTHLEISGITFSWCGTSIPYSLLIDDLYLYTNTIPLWIPTGMQAALLLVHVEDLNTLNLHVTNSSGLGLLGWNVLGHSTVNDSSFSYNNYEALSFHQRNPSHCKFDSFPINAMSCTGGNAAFVFQDTASCPPYNMSVTYSLHVTHTDFKHGVNVDYEDWDFPLYYFYPAGGLTFLVGQSSYKLVVVVEDVSIDSNIGYTGANLVVCMQDPSGGSTVTIRRSSSTNGNSELDLFAKKAFSGGIYFFYGTSFDYYCPEAGCYRGSSQNYLYISSCVIANNLAFHGAAMYIESHISEDKCKYVEIEVFKTQFINNIGSSAIVHTDHTEEAFIISDPLNVHFIASVFERNNIISSDMESNPSEFQAVLAFRMLKNNPRIQDCVIQDNNGTGLYASFTTVELLQVVVFQRNSGENGGAISLGRQGYIILGHYSVPVQLTIQSNTGIYGGGIYIEDTCLEHACASTWCFYRPPTNWCKFIPYGTLVTMRNNVATVAGNSIYGGHLDLCSVSCSGFRHPGTEIFDDVFDYPINTSLTEISSDPKIPCFCVNQKPACEVNVRSVEAYPGALFSVDAVGVGQLSGTVPTVVVGKVRDGHSGTLGTQQDAQPLGTECGQLVYRVNAIVNYTELQVQVNLERDSKQPLFKIIALNFNDCPLGFTLVPELGQCDCIRFLSEKGIFCDIDTLKFQRQSPLWIGYSQNSILIHDNCPFDYCTVGTLWISLHDTSTQCEFSRSGILCGQCKPGLSSVFGTSRCKQCSNDYLSLLIPSALAGFLLVLLLMYCDLTVSKGTLNGLIFYANIVRVNHNIIFPAGENNVLTVFIAWLNLDLGIETCFYDGMDEYGRTWLQFVFPVYIWMIVGAIIVVSWYSSLAVKITGSNAIAVLATLFLLSYTKIQRTVLTALSLTVIPSHDGGTSVVWLYDGNVPYFSAKHAVLFFTAILVAVAFILPFTLLVLFGPLLQAKFSRQLMKLKLTPILDAYQGPYKDKFRCWTGVMLVLRSVLLLAFSVNALGSPRLNLLLIVSLMIIVLGFTSNVGAVYKQLSVNILDSFYVVNLILLAAWTEFNRQGDSKSFKKNQAAISYVLVSTAFIGFLAILCYHAVLQVKQFMHHHDIHFPLHPQSQARDIQLEAVSSQPPEPVVNPRVPTFTEVVIRARESLLESN